MNHSYTRASDAVSADAVSTRAFLQQAVDHYPRLAAFSFTLKLPYRETMSEYRSLILRFKGMSVIQSFPDVFCADIISE